MTVTFHSTSKNGRDSRGRIKPHSNAVITGTFLDGSRVPLLVNGLPADAQWAWARGNKRAELTFKLTLREPGQHRLQVGTKSVSVEALGRDNQVR